MRVAPLRLRLLAAFLDVVVFGFGMAALIGAGIAGELLYRRIRDERDDVDDGEEIGQDDGGEDEPHRVEDDVPHDVGFATRRWHQSARRNAALKGAAAGLAVSGRNWRSPGFGWSAFVVRSVIVGMVFDEVWQAVWRSPFSSRVRGNFAGINALAPKIRELEREYPEGRARALAELSHSKPGISAGGCGWLLAGPLASDLVLALSSRDGWTIRDRITGTGVIVDG